LPVKLDRDFVRLTDGTTVHTAVPIKELAPASDYTMGVRAEAISIGRSGTGDTDAVVEVIERLGDRTLVYARIADNSLLVAEAKGDSPLAPGAAVALTFDGRRTHLFDAAGRGYHTAEAA